MEKLTGPPDLKKKIVLAAAAASVVQCSSASMTGRRTEQPMHYSVLHTCTWHTTIVPTTSIIPICLGWYTQHKRNTYSLKTITYLVPCMLVVLPRSLIPPPLYVCFYVSSRSREYKEFGLKSIKINYLAVNQLEAQQFSN